MFKAALLGSLKSHLCTLSSEGAATMKVWISICMQYEKLNLILMDRHYCNLDCFSVGWFWTECSYLHIPLLKHLHPCKSACSMNKRNIDVEDSICLTYSDIQFNEIFCSVLYRLKFCGLQSHHSPHLQAGSENSSLGWFQWLSHSQNPGMAGVLMYKSSLQPSACQIKHKQ